MTDAIQTKYDSHIEDDMKERKERQEKICKEMEQMRLRKAVQSLEDECLISCSDIYKSHIHGTIFELVEKRPEFPWNWVNLSQNPDLPMSYVMKFPEKPWYWGIISQHPNLTVQVVEMYPNMPWDWQVLQKRSFKKN